MRCCWSSPMAAGSRTPAPAAGVACFRADRLVELAGLPLLLRLDSIANRPPLIANLSAALVVVLSIALSAVVVLLAYDVRRRSAAERRLAESLAFSQGDGGFTRHRPARPRAGRPHHLRQPGLLHHGGLQRRGVAGHARSGPPAQRSTPPPLLAARAGRGIHPAATPCGWPATRRRAKATKPSSCAATASASRC